MRFTLEVMEAEIAALVKPNRSVELLNPLSATSILGISTTAFRDSSGRTKGAPTIQGNQTVFRDPTPVIVRINARSNSFD